MNSNVAACPKCGTKIRYSLRGPQLILCGLCANALRMIKNGTALEHVSDEEIQDVSTPENHLRQELMEARVEVLERHLKLEAHV